MITAATSSSLNHSFEWDDEVARSYEEGLGFESGSDPNSNYTIPGPFAKTPEIGFIVTAVLVTLIMIVIVVGNMLVCIAIATEKSLKTTQNWFIASLAVSDFLIGLLIMPFSLARELMGYWIFGGLWCDIHAALDVLICTASINNLCLISLDRYWSVTHAVEYLRKRTASRAVVMICGVWLLSALISLPPLIGWRKRSEQKNSLPQCSVSEDLGYVLYSALGSFYVPAVVMVFVYIKIFMAARKRARRAMERKKTLAARNKAAIAATQQPLAAQHSVASSCDNNSLRRRAGCEKKFSPPPIVIVNTEVEEGSPESDASSPPISPDGDTMGVSALEAEHHLLRHASHPANLTQLAQQHADTNMSQLALQHQQLEAKARAQRRATTNSSSSEFPADNASSSSSSENHQQQSQMPPPTQTPSEQQAQLPKVDCPQEQQSQQQHNQQQQPTPHVVTLQTVSNSGVEMDSLRPLRMRHSESCGSGLSLSTQEYGIEEGETTNSSSHQSSRITRADLEREPSELLGCQRKQNAEIPRQTESIISQSPPIATTTTTTTTATTASPAPVNSNAALVVAKQRRTQTEAERNRKKIAKARERRATMILGLIMAAFILAWLPFFLFYVLGALCESCKVNETMFAVAFWLGYCNSAVNPIIYTIFNRDFRRAFRKILFK
ncbi:alpha-2C adrenergic receptor-like [Galendromus occidentalis]|uniref:Alpha-2C adrenergic receptor-like n=1 Tax=Galendromus occidentalis TaxID=34638 RepID=A0AAJ6VWQ7_9ACAR|nr:alpha-2C adrenergic receptor-like [Galendromus occidentalis]